MRYVCAILLLCASCVSADELVYGKARGHTNALTPNIFDMNSRLDATIERDTVFWMTFPHDEGTNWWDFSRSSYDGTSISTPTWATNGGGSLFCDYTSSESVNIGDMAAIDGQAKFSIVAWVNSVNNTGARALVTKDNIGTARGIALYADNGVWSFQVNLDQANYAQIVYNAAGLITNWVHVAAVFDGTAGATNTQIFLYNNGISSTAVGRGMPIAQVTNNSLNLLVGDFTGTVVANIGLNGYVRGLMIITNALTSNQVWALYQRGY